MYKPRNIIFLIFFGLLNHSLCHAQATSSEAVISAESEIVEAVATEVTTAEAEENALKVSREAIASLEGQLSEEQFTLVKNKLVGQPFEQLDFSALREATITPEEEGATPIALFEPETLHKVQNSLELYFDMLGKIEQVVPLLISIDEDREQIKKLEESLDSLMKEEQETTQQEIEELKRELGKSLVNFKDIAHHLDLESINFDKLPGMLADLRYDDAFYDVVFAKLSEYIGLVKKAKTAGSIIESLSEVSQAIQEVEQKLKAATTEQEKEALSTELQELVKRKNNLSNDFTLNATGIDPVALSEKTTKEIDVKEELTKVFSPIIVGLTEFTEPSRRIEFLRSNIAYYQQHLPKMHSGIVQIDVLLTEVQDKQAKAKLLEEKEYWEKQEKEFSTKLEIAHQQLIELENRKLSPFDAFENAANAITSKRGMNIMFAILVFIVTFLVLLVLRRLIQFINPLNYIPRLRFAANVLDVFLYLLTFILATLAMVVSLYISGEVLALAIILVVLLALTWAIKGIIPQFVEQIKLLLGYGAVRQGERVIYNGLPWHVDSIGIYSYLRNPALTGGFLRLPIKDLIDMRSRPYDEHESWFPTREGDNVLLLNRGSISRKVVMQTPQRVHFDWYGVPESIPTSDFVSQHIRNLSKGPFWEGVNLYLDYKHRHEALDDVIDKLSAVIDEKFKAHPFFGDKLLEVWVDLAGLADTSLSVMMWVKMQPEAAEEYDRIAWHLNKFSLIAANQYGWEIRRFHAIHQDQPEGLNPPTMALT